MVVSFPVVYLIDMAELFSPISWQAPTHEYAERSTDWYWALGVLALAAAVLAIFLGNILLAVIIGLSSFIVGFLAMKEPRMCDIEVNDKGIRIDTNLYPYRSLKSFAIDDESRERAQLIVMTTSLLNPELVLPFSDHVNPDQVRDSLLQKLPEGEHVESALSRIADIFGF